MFQKLKKYQFLFEELVKRDFKKKYKGTILGMSWSIFAPLLQLLVMRIVFTQFFGRNMEHYTTYLFCGNLIFSYFNESTSQGMTSLIGNAAIFTKVNVPKYLFLFSKNVQALINFGLVLVVFFIFCLIDGITFTWKFILLLVPILSLLLFNHCIGLILSALFVFFRDVQYLWSIFTQLLMYASAIFYFHRFYSPMMQNLSSQPCISPYPLLPKNCDRQHRSSVWFHLLLLADVAIVLGIGCWMYKKYNTKFLYYVYGGDTMAMLELQKVSIRYITGDFKDIGLKEYFLRRIKRNYHIKEFWADKDVTFSLEQGDMLGIIGTNGAGKSTLLKVISGIMEPTKGFVKRNGSVAALLELSSGFDGDLTVKENAYLRGAMLGYTRKLWMKPMTKSLILQSYVT